MALSHGTRLGHYDVTALLGEGGMGQVWQATDTQLQAHRRGLYLNRDRLGGEVVRSGDLYAAVPLLNELGQIGPREFEATRYSLKNNLAKDSPLTVSDVIERNGPV